MFDKGARNQNEVFAVLVSQAPNGIKAGIFQRKLPRLTLEEILDALNGLVIKGLVTRNEAHNDFTGQTQVIFSLKEPFKYPIRRTIRIGSYEFPRFLHGDLVGAEDINEPFETLSDYVDQLEKRFVQISNEQTQRYWANTITLFGLFMAVFTIILSAVPKTVVDSSWSFQQVLWLNAAAVLPQFVVLLVFVVVLRLMFRRQ